MASHHPAKSPADQNTRLFSLRELDLLRFEGLFENRSIGLKKYLDDFIIIFQKIPLLIFIRMPLSLYNLLLGYGIARSSLLNNYNIF